MPLIPFKLQVLQALTAQLQTINATGSYVDDVSSAVFRGRGKFGESDPLPMLSILEVAKPVKANSGGINRLGQLYWWELLVQGWVNDDREDPLDPAYMLEAEVCMCLSQVIATTSFEQPLYPDLYKFGGLIADLEIGPGVCRPPEPEVSTKAHFYLPVGILMAYDPSTPFQKIGS